MLRNYFKTAWRNLWKNKAYSTINILGLAVGLAACLTILLFVFYEKSFDSFHHRNIYRLNEVQKFPGMISSQKVALSMYPMAPTIKQEFPEVLNFCRVRPPGRFQATYGERRVYLKGATMVDSTFLQIFDFKLLKGDRLTALHRAKSIVLTETSAKNLFGDEEPLGKSVINYGGDTTTFIVTGVLQDPPQNSQLQFEALFPFSGFTDASDMENWGGNWLYSYFELAPNTNIASMEKKFPDYLKRHMREDNWKFYELFLLPLKKVHAGASDIGLDDVNYQQFDEKYTNIFFTIAIIVLVIACINFMNLSTARSAERAREVGVRKSVGAHRWQLSAQFLSESVIVTFLALVLAVIFTYLALPWVNHLSQRTLHFPLFTSPYAIPLLLLGAVVIGIISGLYPAAYLSSFQPVKVLKGTIQTGRNKSALRNVLVVAQFSSAIFLIIATLFALRQLKFMEKKDPGFNKDQVVTLSLNRITFKKYAAFKQELLQNSLVSGVTAAQDQLGSHMDQSGILFIGNGPKRDLTGTRLIVDPDYLRTYKIPIIYGRDFSADGTGSGKEYVINETMAKELMKEDSTGSLNGLLGRTFGFDSSGTIIGIAKDFNFNSLHHHIETLFLFYNKNWGLGTMSVRINGAKAKESIDFIQSVWKKNYPDQPFEYQFLDDHFKEVYRADQQVSSIVAVLAALAIIISCLGLFGLASYSAERRVKEVGIRKVLGASVQNIVSMLSKDFLKYVLIATLIAFPLAWFSVDHWLQDFAYRISMSWWIFILAGILALSIALITVSFQAIKAALANPVKSLRSE